jgi:pyrimidine-nucleoside phosphorylase
VAILPQALIRNKRDGGELADDELRAFVAGVTDGSFADYQVSAMLMAIFFRGMSDRELATFADAMLRSGEILDLSSIDRPRVDKHSTGGVGDKISLPLAPAVAACGAAVPMVSGRGLGHTGGTLDKLESIPGFRIDLPVADFIRQVAELGVCLIGQTAEIAPADRRLYAIRDVTATVESIPLIASSIMSKKLAEGIDALVLDCKVGDGAFMKREADARELAAAIRAIGAAAGKKVHVCLTDMNAPIGRMVGNALEVAESIEVLGGGGPADTRELTCVLGGEMLVAAGIEADPAAARARIEAALDGGEALAVFEKMVAAQGGDPRVASDPDGILPRARRQRQVLAPRAGAVAAIGAEAVGVAALALGAGRARKEDEIDPAAGIELLCRVGDRVEEGQPLAVLHYNDRDPEPSAARLVEAIEIGDTGEARASRLIEILR